LIQQAVTILVQADEIFFQKKTALSPARDAGSIGRKMNPSGILSCAAAHKPKQL